MCNAYEKAFKESLKDRALVIFLKTTYSDHSILGNAESGWESAVWCTGLYPLVPLFSRG